MVIDSVLTPWFVFCRLLPSLHLAVAISPLLSVISSLVTAASLLGWLGTETGGFVLTWGHSSINPSLKCWVWVVAVNRSIMTVGGEESWSQALLVSVILKQSLDHGALPQLETSYSCPGLTDKRCDA